MLKRNKPIFYIVALISFSIMLVWAGHLKGFRFICEGNSTTKFTTALLGFTTSISFLLIRVRNHWANIACFLVIICQVCFIEELIVAIFMDRASPYLFFETFDESNDVLRKGMPSFCTLVNYLLVSMVPVFGYFRQMPIVKAIGYIVGFSAILAHAGHVFQIEVLFCSYKNANYTSVALPTIVIFTLISYGILKSDQNDYS